jgi:4-diphosphocytidyl-2-C-methyl-D-erythritol kinase
VAVFAGAADVVRASPDQDLSLAVDGPFAGPLRAEPDNLVLRAARAVAETAGIAPAARLSLTKRLPVASGIGGGSADAAAALRLLARFWGIGGAVSLPAIAARLGADVPVCLASRPARMSGIGEALAPAPALPRGGIVLLNPGAALPTAEVFRARGPGFSPPASLPAGWRSVAEMAEHLAQLRNDLEPAARALRPEINDVLAALAATSGCLLARMSGSGATCFGLFATEAAAARAADDLSRPGWWCWGGGLVPAHA